VYIDILSTLIQDGITFKKITKNRRKTVDLLNLLDVLSSKFNVFQVISMRERRFFNLGLALTELHNH